jgi:hypothetical protein
MDQDIITPIRHSPVLYKSFFHKQPYTSNIGAVTNVSFEHDTILVTIQIPTSDITSKVKRIVISDRIHPLLSSIAAIVAVDPAKRSDAPIPACRIPSDGSYCAMQSVEPSNVQLVLYVSQTKSQEVSNASFKERS